MKGITDTVLFNGVELRGWSVTLLPLTDMGCYKPARGKQEPSTFLPGSLYTGMYCVQQHLLETLSFPVGMGSYITVGPIGLGQFRVWVS